MNLTAIDIGNSNIGIGLFLKGQVDSVESVAGGDKEKLAVMQCSVSRRRSANKIVLRSTCLKDTLHNVAEMGV